MRSEDIDWSFIGFGYLLALSIILLPFAPGNPLALEHVSMKILNVVVGIMMIAGISLAVKEDMESDSDE